MNILVDTEARLLSAGDLICPCAIGRSGVSLAGDKREGDGTTPLGRWPIRGALLRPGSGFLPPVTIPWRWIRTDDGWSDDPASADYNRPISLPADGSAETLSRSDGAYDVVLVLGYNDRPPQPGLGSAIFLHLRNIGDTEGCVAIDRGAMMSVLERLETETLVEIV